jgi:hypothetical protein
MQNNTPPLSQEARRALGFSKGPVSAAARQLARDGDFNAARASQAGVGMSQVVLAPNAGPALNVAVSQAHNTGDAHAALAALHQNEQS